MLQVSWNILKQIVITILDFLILITWAKKGHKALRLASEPIFFKVRRYTKNFLLWPYGKSTIGGSVYEWMQFEELAGENIHWFPSQKLII